MGYSNTLNNSTFTLTTSNNVIINQPNVAGTNQWNVNAGNASIAGNLQIGGGVDGASKISVVDITTGAITVGTDLVFYSSSGNANNAVLNITGAGTLNLGGAGTAAMTLTNTGNKFGTFNPGASSIVNYNSSTSSQTVNFTAIAPAVTYANLSFKIPVQAALLLLLQLLQANVTGTVRVQTGLFQYGTGMSASGTGTFEVDNGATFEMTSTATFPVFTHYNLRFKYNSIFSK